MLQQHETYLNKRAGEQMSDVEAEVLRHQKLLDTNSRKTASAPAANAPPRKIG